MPVAKKMIFNSFFQGHKVFWKIGRPFAHSLHVSYLWSFICLALLGYCHSTWWSSWRVGEEGALVVTGNNYMGGISLCLWWTIWSEWNRQKLFRWRTFSCTWRVSVTSLSFQYNSYWLSTKQVIFLKIAFQKIGYFLENIVFSIKTNEVASVFLLLHVTWSKTTSLDYMVGKWNSWPSIKIPHGDICQNLILQS